MKSYHITQKNCIGVMSPVSLCLHCFLNRKLNAKHSCYSLNSPDWSSYNSWLHYFVYYQYKFVPKNSLLFFSSFLSCLFGWFLLVWLRWFVCLFACFLPLFDCLFHSYLALFVCFLPAFPVCLFVFFLPGFFCLFVLSHLALFDCLFS